MKTYDYVIIGSGLNSLSCAALLARKGKKVCIVEREEQLGGCIKTDRDSMPGFTIDLMSISHVQFITSPAYAELGDELHAAGLEYCFNQYPTGVMLTDGSSLILTTDHEDNCKRITTISEKDAQAFGQLVGKFMGNTDIIFPLLGNEPFSFASAKAIAAAAWKRGFAGTLSSFSELLHTSRRVLEQNFESEVVKALFAPMSLHAGIGPDVTLSGLMSQLIGFSLTMAGDPMVKGGSDNFVKAFQKVIEGYGGELHTGQDVEQVLSTNGRATGVKTVDGTEYRATNGVIGNVTPTQLYQRLLKDEEIPDTVKEQANNYRYGRSCMIIHLSLDEMPEWADPEMAKVALMHLTPGLDGVTKAVSESERGYIPGEASICVVQPAAVDPSRVPAGKWQFWLQLLELPKVIKGDSRGELSVPADGQWNPEISAQVADRMIDDLSKVVPNLKSIISSRKVISPADLPSMNINLVEGDPYSGHCGIDQSMMFRPMPAVKNHKTPIKNLYQIGASTHPGAGLGGMSGYLVAKQLGG
jgi:phytoene dehydrogenase-like protein